jgi:hypothetical protein
VIHTSETAVDPGLTRKGACRDGNAASPDALASASTACRLPHQAAVHLTPTTLATVAATAARGVRGFESWSPSPGGSAFAAGLRSAATATGCPVTRHGDRQRGGTARHKPCDTKRSSAVTTRFRVDQGQLHRLSQGGAVEPESTAEPGHSIRRDRSARHLHRSSVRSKPRRAGHESHVSIGRSQAARPNGRGRPSAAWPVSIRLISMEVALPSPTYGHNRRDAVADQTDGVAGPANTEPGFRITTHYCGNESEQTTPNNADRPMHKLPRCGADPDESITRQEPGRDPAARRDPSTSDGTDADDRHTGSITLRKGLRYSDAPDCNG